MNYPDKIYPKLEIVEKDICGVTHYGVVRIYNLFGIKFKRYWKVSGDTYIPFVGWGRRWHTSKVVIEGAISNYYQHREYLFREKMAK